MKTKKILKGIGIFLLILLLLIGILLIVCKIYAGKNNPVMYDTIADGLDELKKEYTVNQLDTGEFENMRFYGIMNFHVDQYEIEELGNLSVLTADMGFMQMMSFTITPFEKNVPLCAMDYMYIFGNRKSYIEYYSVAANTESDEYRAVKEKLRNVIARYDDVEDIPMTESYWYDSILEVVTHKKLSSSSDEQNKEMFLDALKAYISEAKKLPALSAEERSKQIQNTHDYSDGLITKGGVSTDVFKKALGEEKTRQFFDNVFFGTNRYQ